MKYTILFLLLLFIPLVSYASHESTECNISINGEIIPITYITENRNNPDMSFYAGDGFHYLFTFSGIEECTSFSVNSLISEGYYNVLSHDSLMWNIGIQNNHSHQDTEMTAQYLTTTHYYVDKISYVDCDGYRCQEITLAENPSYSVRKDQTPSTSLQKLLDGLSTAGTYSIRTEETQDWGFTNINESHKHNNPHENESDNSIESFEKYVESRCTDLEKYSGCVYGHVEIQNDMKDEKCMFEELDKMNISHDMENDFCVDVSHNMSLSIEGTKINCSYIDGKEVCKTVKITNTKDITPNILSSEFEIILTDPPVKDRDNYDGKNKDGTYYPHDPIGIIHNPSMLWKDYRAETIQFETTKQYELSNKYEYDCHSNLCEHKIKLDSVYSVSYEFGNGQGITIYNTTNVDFGLHNFEYYSVATNLGDIISTTQNSMQIEIVDYFPQYKSYPYPLLLDNKELAFDDRQAVALYYFGSVEDDVIFEERRSKINYVYNVDVGYDPWIPHIILQNFTLSEGITVSEDVLQSHNQTVVFSQSGYGKLYFEHPLGDVIIPDGIAQFENVTSYTTLASVDFAAKDTLVEFYTMRYPEASFTKNLIIQSVNQNDTIMYDDSVQVEITPYDAINTEYITQYIYDKILFDTNDETFADIISGDVYPMEQKYSGNGIINTTISKTSVFFDEYIEQTNNVNATFTENIISDLTSLLDSPDTIRLLAPYDFGLSALSPTTLTITVNDITNVIDNRYYTFDGKQTIIVNTQTDNILHADRDKNKIVIYPPENFGLIDTVYIDDIPIQQECQSGCVILYPPEDEIILSVYNKWEGIALVVLPEIILPEIPIPDEPNYMMILAIVILLILIYVGYKKIKLN